MRNEIPWQDRRKLRADALASMALRAVDRYLDRSPEALDANVVKLAHRALFDLFYQTGADIISDMDRANAGLAPRGDTGYTESELQIMEAHKQKIMMQPLVGMFPIPGLEK